MGARLREFANPGVLSSIIASRAGIPGVAGRLGVPAKKVEFWKRAVFFKRKKMVLFFLAFWRCFCVFSGGVFALLGGVFVLLGCFFCFSRVSALFWRELIC